MSEVLKGIVAAWKFKCACVWPIFLRLPLNKEEKNQKRMYALDRVCMKLPSNHIFFLFALSLSYYYYHYYYSIIQMHAACIMSETLTQSERTLRKTQHINFPQALAGQ